MRYPGYSFLNLKEGVSNTSTLQKAGSPTNHLFSPRRYGRLQDDGWCSISIMKAQAQEQDKSHF
jgi:hypothetical protein